MAAQKTVEVSVRDLPMQCPPPGVPAWNMHPRVFLDLTHCREAVCPYCQTRYVLQGEAPRGH